MRGRKNEPDAPALFRIVLGIAALALIVPGWVSDLVGLLVATIAFGLLLSGRVGSSTAPINPANRSPLEPLRPASYPPQLG